MLTSPLTLKGIIGAYNPQLNANGALVDLVDVLQFLSSGGSGTAVYVDNGWVIKGTAAITASSSAPGQYAITIPQGGILETLQKRFADTEDLNEDGNIIINIDWGTTSFNLGATTPMTPFVSFLDSLGNQFSASELGISVKTAIAEGLTSTTINILDAISLPFTIKMII
jgi:hypothetical protein